MNGVTVPLAAATGKPVYCVLPKSPVSPMKCPVAITAAFTVVMVGQSEWLLAKLTPVSRSFAKAGARSGDTAAARKPSATNRMMFCCASAGRGAVRAASSTLARSSWSWTALPARAVLRRV